ncbi:MAG: DUF2892 domain-containing protein [Gemmatimonadota bacterium]
MIRNVGGFDRTVRIVLGVLILGLWGVFEGPWKYLAFVGLLPLGTGLTGNCPVYSLRRFSTVAKNR